MSMTAGTHVLPARTRINPWRLALLAAAGTMAVLGFVPGGGTGDADLLLLMRFMAVVKAAMAAAAVALVAWRLSGPVRTGTAAAYVAATALTWAGPGLLWGQHVASGAMAVHGGLSALMLVAWTDRTGWNAVLGAALARRRARSAAR